MTVGEGTKTDKSRWKEIMKIILENSDLEVLYCKIKKSESTFFEIVVLEGK